MKILIATGNAHKVEEIFALLGDGFELVSLRAFPHIEMPEETGQTMRENARLKAQHCARESGLISLADDSGIEVDALNGAPGVLSARWMEGSDAERTRALWEKMRGEENRAARYRCAICVAFPDEKAIEKIMEIEATCEGELAREAQGENGFGYDPIFELTAETGAQREYSGQTMAQVPAEIKAQISHRARAVEKLKLLFIQS